MFWKDIKHCSWYRNRVLAYFITGVGIALNLTIFLFGWSVKAIVSGTILGIANSQLYEKAFRFYNRYGLMLRRYGVTEYHGYLTAPFFTAATSSAVKIIWSKFHYRHIIGWLLLLEGIVEAMGLIQALRRMIKELNVHEYHATNAYLFLRHYRDDPNLRDQSTKILEEWAHDIYDDFKDDSSVEASKSKKEE